MREASSKSPEIIKECTPETNKPADSSRLFSNPTSTSVSLLFDCAMTPKVEQALIAARQTIKPSQTRQVGNVVLSSDQKRKFTMEPLLNVAHVNGNLGNVSQIIAAQRNNG